MWVEGGGWEVGVRGPAEMRFTLRNLPVSGELVRGFTIVSSKASEYSPCVSSKLEVGLSRGCWEGERAAGDALRRRQPLTLRK